LIGQAAFKVPKTDEEPGFDRSTEPSVFAQCQPPADSAEELKNVMSQTTLPSCSPLPDGAGFRLSAFALTLLPSGQKFIALHWRLSFARTVQNPQGFRAVGTPRSFAKIIFRLCHSARLLKISGL